MATRPLERLILRVPGGEPSILFRRNNVQWTEDGDELPHFSRRLLRNRFRVWLNERQAFLWPHAGIVAEASYFAAYCRGARKLFIYATDRPRGDRSTGASKIALRFSPPTRNSHTTHPAPRRKTRHAPARSPATLTNALAKKTHAKPHRKKKSPEFPRRQKKQPKQQQWPPTRPSPRPTRRRSSSAR